MMQHVKPEHFMDAQSFHGRAIVIGSGFGGIASALRLRALGYDVTLLERLSCLGGRAQVFEKQGFRHDAGPTVITAPFLFDELFELFGEKREDYADFVSVDPWYRFYFADGRSFDYGEDMDAFKAEMAKFNPDDAHRYDDLLAESKAIFDVGFEKLADEPFQSFTSMIKQAPALLRLRSDRSVARFVGRHIKDEMLHRALTIQPLLVGGNPFATTSIYALIHYLERKWGVYFCMGGTGALVKALEELMHRQNIRILKNADVEEICLEGRFAQSVRLTDGRVIEADMVVCNADPPTVYEEMLPQRPKLAMPGRPMPDALTQYSMGLFVLYFGTKRQYPEVAHHTIWMGERYKEHLADIFDRKILTEDFSLYLHRPTATDASFAPKDCDSFYVLCPVPNMQADIDWQIEGEKLRDRIVKALGETILPDLEETITADFWMDPTDFRNQYRSKHGAGFSISPLFRQSAWFRYKNRDPHIHNLFFVGAGTHPGAGMPGVLTSAKVLENLIKREGVRMPEVAI